MNYCPSCGSDVANAESNHIDEAPYRTMARSARMLRQCGETGAAADVLTGLASVKIINFIRPKWRCACGATYD